MIESDHSVGRDNFITLLYIETKKSIHFERDKPSINKKTFHKINHHLVKNILATLAFFIHPETMNIKWLCN